MRYGLLGRRRRHQPARRLLGVQSCGPNRCAAPAPASDPTTALGHRSGRR